MADYRNRNRNREDRSTRSGGYGYDPEDEFWDDGLDEYGEAYDDGYADSYSSDQYADQYYGRRSSDSYPDPYGRDPYRDSYDEAYRDSYADGYDGEEQRARRQQVPARRERRPQPYDSEREEGSNRYPVRRASQRAAEAARRRRERREREIRRARIRLGLIVGGVAAVLVLVLVLRRLSAAGLLTLSGSAGNVTEAAAEITTAAAEADTTETETAAGTLPTEEQTAADRAAKNYSAAVATFWPYYNFYTTENTRLIPSIPSDEQAYEKMAAGRQDFLSGRTASTDETEAAEAGTEESGTTVENTLEAEAVLETTDAGTADGTTAASTTVTALDGSIVSPEDQVGGDYVASYYGIVVNADNGEILAQKRMNERIVPASMTKVMTLLTAVETLGLTEDSPELSDMVTLTTEDEEYAYINDSSAVCWMPGDTASVEDLMYGTILPSGADAAVALSEYVSGSQANFVKLMNQKAQELGIGETTHFTNCVGVFDQDHYSTVYDIAVIMKAALENDLCRKVLSGHVWTTSPTSVHPEGITVSNWFLRRIEDRETNGLVLCAKTGYVNQSGFCAVSYQEGDDGSHLIVCTAYSSGNWRCINDHVALYREYAKPVQTEDSEAAAGQ